MTQTMHRTDHHLKAAVVDELRWTPTVNPDHVGVSVNDGAITLSGEVNRFPEKSAAVAAALRVAGVRAVADEIVVRSAAETDDVGIAAQARRAFEASVSVPDGVQATVRDSRVTLTGAVPWNYQRKAARKLVEDIPGVRFIQNEIKIVPKLPFAADVAKANIQAALIRNAQTEADRIQVTTSGTEIELTGTTHTWAERSQAGHIAWNTPGVTAVHNKLRVTG